MITVTQKGLRVDYTNHEGQSSSIRVTEDVGALFAAAPDLLKTLSDLIWLYQRRDETRHDCFERAATRFLKETGMLAPGKDQASAYGDTPTYDERKAAYDKWYSNFWIISEIALAKASEPTP